MAEEQAAHHLLNVLEERNLKVDLDTILHAFEDEDTQTAAAAWIEEYLHEDTLLTKEELELYQSLKYKGQLQQYESEGEPARPIRDHEIATAIESVQGSIMAIEAQCRVLEAQRDALMKLKALDKPNLDVEHARNERRKKEGQESKRLDFAIEDVSASLAEQSSEIQKEIDTGKHTLKSYVSERLGSDDQILSRLPKMVSQLVTEKEADEDEKSVEQWCKALISYRTAEIKAQVDAIYLNSSSKYAMSEASITSEDQLRAYKAQLQAEMQELHSEIASVAEMVVEHEIRKPMSEMRARKDKEAHQARSSWLNYILSTLKYMSKRLDVITEFTNDMDELQQVFVHISGKAKMCATDADASSLSPIKKRTGPSPSSAFTPMVTLQPTQSLHLPIAAQDALRYAGVSSSHESIESLQDSLIHARLEGDRRLQEHYESASSSTHERLAERLSRGDVDSSVILDVLYKHTPFQQINLTDPIVEQQLRHMEQDLEEKKREFRDLEEQALGPDDARVKAFIAKYSRQ